MKCYGCRETIDRDSVRVIADCIEVCPSCYRHLRGLIVNGYFETEETVSDELVFEVAVEQRFSVFA